MNAFYQPGQALPSKYLSVGHADTTTFRKPIYSQIKRIMYVRVITIKANISAFKITILAEYDIYFFFFFFTASILMYYLFYFVRSHHTCKRTQEQYSRVTI